MADLSLRTIRYVKQIVADSWIYTKHKILGSSYADYYAERMNRRIRRDKSWGLTEREFHLEYLKRHNLRPENSVLDFGCGAINSGIHFIRYLDADCYVGVDIAEAVIAEAERRVSEFSLASKRPALFHLPSGNLDGLPQRQFDYIWAQSVLTHMPPADIQNLFERIRRHMNKSSVFYATFMRSEKSCEQFTFSDWAYSIEHFSEMARSRGMNVEIMTDWSHPQDVFGRDTMARISIAGNN